MTNSKYPEGTSTVASWVGESGVPGRLRRKDVPLSQHTLTTVEEMLRPFGCGAWRGRTACGDPATWTAIGGTELMMMTHRAISSPVLPTVALLCDRHAGLLSQQVVRDMPASLRKEQEREFRKLLKLEGAEGQEKEAREILLVRLEEKEELR